jgi:uncharacterized membrane protein YeaQ/YmgE (transglycosylase-associated protein family)
MMDAGLNIDSTAQHWVNLILIWLGFGTLVAIVVRCLLPGREPANMLSMILIGMVGTCVGPLIVSTIWHIDKFNPISPIGFFASFLSSFAFLVIYQLGTAYSKRRRHDYD